MPEIPHILEFPPAPPAGPSAGTDAAKNLAQQYAAAFLGGAAGQCVLRDLLRKFPPSRSRFGPVDGPETAVATAAKIDGQSDVMREILAAVKSGAAATGAQLPEFLHLLT